MAAPKPYPGMPRWMKLSSIGLGVAIVIAIVLMIVVGDHGPGRHMPGNADRPAGDTAHEGH